MQLLDLYTHLGPELGVEVGERLIEEADPDLLDQRAPDRDPLALAAGKLRRLAIEEVIDLQELRCPLDPTRDVLAGEPSARKAEDQIPAHRLCRVQRIGLEHHGEAAILRIEVGHLAPVD
jgi:hypothetical protein